MAVSDMVKKVFLVALGLTLAWAGPASAAGKVRAFVSILPQKYFVERIGGELTDVSVLVQPGANPHMYEPTPRQMAALAKAQVYFAIGINLEDVWLPKLKGANRDMLVVRTQEGVDKIPMIEHHHDEAEHHHDEAEHHHDEAEHEGHDHAAAHSDEHDHGILDPHIWLDPVRVKTIARNTCDGLVRADPAHKTEYEANLAAFLNELDKLDATIAEAMAAIPVGKRAFMVFHPSWGYFAQRYGLTQVAIEAGGNEPSPRHLAEIIEHGRELGVTVVFVQPQFSKRSAEVIASELNARVLPLDPLAEDWKGNLLHAAEAFGRALS
ncbi:zinc ABC transporter substrate-binding protein [Pseudodesulfovibrio thermohalotolerans]|uniref:metal ABC transporter solute-binding protein, Zn/Mn family n=1 Tax=Pseudodesulfovibrio thermohalotolerans TaxID=2880651 RepID=UPI002442E0E1|nr:zinc ABC transporter substrate-binding protein [Pseudodesulfovibrio thermohalotolerans]WFS62097.1 zinc ABC transporter substrate-binding protein [Pseudodesulfovibrio thermohalotolerans]